MTKVKQVVKTFVEMMSEVDENSWQAFLSREEERMHRKFYAFGKNLGEESRLVAYLNFVCRNPDYHPKSIKAFSFFETWKKVSGYMPFEGKAGNNPGKKADVDRLNEGIQYYFRTFLERSYVTSMTQEQWDLDEAYHFQKVFGAYAEPVDDDIPF